MDHEAVRVHLNLIVCRHGYLLPGQLTVETGVFHPDLLKKGGQCLLCLNIFWIELLGDLVTLDRRG